MKGKGCFTNLTTVALFLSFAISIGVSIFSLPQETYAATSVKVGNFLSGTTAGTTTVTGLPFQPKAVIFFWTRQANTGVINAHDYIGMGFAAGSSIDNRSVSIACQDNPAPAGYTNCGRVMSETYSIMFLSNGDPTLSGRGSVTSFTADGFIVTWTGNRGINAYINYIAIGGDDITNVKAGTITATTSQTTQSFTDVGFQPDFVMFLASLTESVDIPTSHMYLNTGFMTSSIAAEQAAVSICGYDNSYVPGGGSLYHSQSLQRTTKAIMGMSGYCGYDWLASYESMDPLGFTLDFSDDAPTTDTPIFYLALQGGTHRIGAITQSTVTGLFDYNIGFQPVGLFMASFNRVAGDTIGANGEISIGAASSSAAQGTIWGENKNVTAVNPNTAMSITTNSVIRLSNPAAVNAEAALNTFLTNGFRLNWTTVDATQRQIVGWIIGSNSTIVGNNDGTGEPANATLAPDAGATMLDAFTLKTSGGSDTVTAVTVALSSGSSGGLSRVQITSDDGVTGYGYVDDPSSDTVAITVTGMPTVITTPTQYKVRITPKSHGNMPPPATGVLYNVTGTVTGITCTYPKGYYDTASATITIDNDSPDVPTGFNGTPGDTQVILTWANPGDADFSEVVILRSTSTIADIPVEGTQYYQNDPIGTNGTVVRYVGNLQTFTDTGLTNGWDYYYKIFAKDSNGNYSTPGTASVPYPCIPWPVVTANYSGSQIGTINNGTGDQYIGAAFTFQQSSGTAGNITALTISETGNVDADAVLSDVKVYYESGVSGACVYDGGETLITTTSFNTSDEIVLSYIIPITLSPNFTCVYVVFDVGDSVDRSNPYVELEITSSADFTLSGSLVKAGTYPVALPLTTTLNDTHSPGDVSGQTATVGNTELILNWTNPSGGLYDDDYAGVRIRRATGATVPATCSSGTQVADVPSSSTSYVDDNDGLGLINGTQYSYRLCSYDENPGRLYSPGVTITGVTPSNEPTLTYPASPYNDGKNPDTGNTTINFTFKVIYYDFENNAPASGYPKIYIGDNDGYTSYTMSLDASAAYSLRDGTYSNSEQYVYGPIGLGAAQDLRFYFEAQAVAGNLTIVKLPSTGYSTGPSVYLINDANMVGVPKDLGDGLSYGSVLGDDSGVGYCMFWDSAGLDTVDGNLGDWSYCNFGIQKGRGYYIFAASADSYRLDEPDDVGNVTDDASVDIALDTNGGWNMITNPYNINIQLQNVKVMREGDPTEYTFDAAVQEPNKWIGNSIYEWQGYPTGYTFKAYNGSPPAVLEPWMGFFIYVKDITVPTTLRVSKP